MRLGTARAHRAGFLFWNCTRCGYFGGPIALDGRFRLQFVLMTPKPDSNSSAASGASPSAPSNPQGPITMTIDIGGSGLKAMLLDAKGAPVSERQRVVTPEVPTPQAVIKGLDQLHKMLVGKFDR